MTRPFSSRVFESESEVFNPPKVTENSVFLYQSTSEYSNQLRALRTFEFPFLASITLFYPVVSELYMILGMFFLLTLRGIIYEPARRLVVRMDLLPDSESLYIQKIGLGGLVYGQTVGLDDLTKFDAYDVQTQGKNYKKINLLNFLIKRKFIMGE